MSEFLSNEFLLTNVSYLGDESASLFSDLKNFLSDLSEGELTGVEENDLKVYIRKTMVLKVLLKILEENLLKRGRINTWEVRE